MKYKIVLLMLWVATLLYRVIRGRALAPRVPPKRVLVVQNAGLGDVVCTTPVFRAIKKTYPAAVLTVMGDPMGGKLLFGNRDVDAYVTFDSLTAGFRLLRDGGFDAAVIVTPDTVLSALCYLAGIPAVIVPRIVNGYSPLETRLFASIRSIAGLTIVEHRMDSYAPREYLRMLEPLGIHTDDTKKHLAYTEEASRTVDEYVQARVPHGALMVGFSVSAGYKIKQWKPERFAEVMDHLVERHDAWIVIVGRKHDRRQIDKTLRFLKHPERVIDTCDKFNLEELKALISKLSLFIAVDTGPVYIAEAFNTPTIDIVGAVSEEVQPPRGERHLVVVPPSPRVPQLFIMNARRYDRREVLRQLEATTSAQVIEACEVLLRRIRT